MVEDGYPRSSTAQRSAALGGPPPPASEGGGMPADCPLWCLYDHMIIPYLCVLQSDVNIT